jgi:hypothetical protein
MHLSAASDLHSPEIESRVFADERLDRADVSGLRRLRVRYHGYASNAKPAACLAVSARLLVLSKLA